MSQRLTMFMAAALTGLILLPSALAADVTTERILYETGFEPQQGFDPELSLIGQDGWVGDGSGGNGLVTNFFSGEGQHAFIGFLAPTNSGEFLNAWRPINYTPGPTNPPLVRLSLLMSIEDSVTNTNRDDFRWSVYNGAGDRLFSIDFDNHSLEINHLLDDNVFVATGLRFTNSVTYQLTVDMDFERNRWSASLDGTSLATELRLTTRNSPLDFGDADAVWAIRSLGSPGDNFMVFDNYRIAAIERESTPPELVSLGYLGSGKFLMRCVGIPGKSYLLESSTDFAAWIPIKTNTVPDDGFFEHLDESGGEQRFYRMMER